MLRSAASPGSVGFGRFGSGTSGLLMTPLPAGHLRFAAFFGFAASSVQTHRAPNGRPCHARRACKRYLIFASRNSTCFLATGSYFFLLSFSVMVREFLRVT